MGLGGFHGWHLLILLAIATVVFGTGRIKNMGGDLGNAIKGFRQAMRNDDDTPPRREDESAPPAAIPRVAADEQGNGESAPHKTKSS